MIAVQLRHIARPDLSATITFGCRPDDLEFRITYADHDGPSGHTCIHDAAEVSELIAAARWAVKRDGLPGTLRERLYAQRETAASPTWLKPTWQTYQADRDGKPVVRVWRMHRLSPWFGHVVWHERGRYELLRRIAPTHNHRDESAATTGIEFATLGEMTRWLADNQPA